MVDRVEQKKIIQVFYNYTERTDKKLDGVGPIDNRPFIDKLHHFVEKKKNDM